MAIIKGNRFFNNFYALKVLVALSSEELKPIELLYKVCLVGLKNKCFSRNIRNINAFGFYFQNYRKILILLLESYLISVEEDKLSITVDGKAAVDLFSDLDVVKMFRETCDMVEKTSDDGRDYREQYISELNNYTAFFLKGDII